MAYGLYHILLDWNVGGVANMAVLRWCIHERARCVPISCPFRDYMKYFLENESQPDKEPYIIDFMLKVGQRQWQKSFGFCKISLRLMASRLDLFQNIGLSEHKAKETLKNEILAKHLEGIVNTVGENLSAL